MTKRIRKFTNWRVWWRGIQGAFIGGVANTVSAMIHDAEKFNFSDGIHPLWQFALTSGIVSAFLYLKQSPVPPEEEVIEDEEEVEVKRTPPPASG